MVALTKKEMIEQEVTTHPMFHGASIIKFLKKKYPKITFNDSQVYSVRKKELQRLEKNYKEAEESMYQENEKFENSDEDNHPVSQKPRRKFSAIIQDLSNISKELGGVAEMISILNFLSNDGEFAIEE